jgi:chaperonin cofactor prefoldin
MAQAPRSGDANAKAAQQMQGLAAARQRLQGELDAAKRELDAAKAKLSAATADRDRAQAKARAQDAASAQLDAANKANAEQLERARGQVSELVTKFKQTVETLKGVETDRDQLKAEVESRKRALSACVDTNAKLYLLNDEILDRFEQRGFWHQVMDRESFTRLSRTRLENLVDDYRQRAEELRKQAKNTAGAAATPASR